MGKHKEDEIAFLLKFLAVAVLLFALARAAFAQVSPGYQSHSFQYLTNTFVNAAGPSATTASGWNSVFPPKYFTMSVTGTPSAGFEIDLEGSLDNSQWALLATTATAKGAVSSILPKPMLYFRMRAATLGSTDTITATAIGTP